MSDTPQTPQSIQLPLGLIFSFVFMVLKLAEVQPFATWSWLLVFSPMFFFAALSIAVFLFIGAVTMIVNRRR